MSTKRPNDVPTLREAAQQFSRLVRLIRPYWTPLIKGMLLALVLGMVGMVSPYLTKLLIDEVYPTENVTLMHVLVGGVLALTLASTLLGTIRSFFTLYVNTRLSIATRLLFFNHLQHLHTRFFEEHRVGEINSRFQDVGRALESLTKVFQTLFVDGVYLLLVPPFLFFLEWRLALVAIICLPLTFLITALSGPILRRYWKRTSEAYADLNAFQVETLSHIHTFKAMALEHQIYGKGQELMGEALRHQIKAGGLGHAFGAISGVLRGLNTALFTWFGWTLILSQEMSLGDYMAFTAYIGYLYNPLYKFVNLFSEFQQSAVHLSRMFEYLDTPAEQDPTTVYSPPAPISRPLNGEYRLDGVSFGYKPQRPVLKEIELEVSPGSVTMLVGPSGSGKTSLLRLLSGLEQPDAGTLWVDGVPVTQLPLAELRRQVAVVWQDVSLINGSLWDNLTLGAEAPEARELDRIVRLCGLSEVVGELAEGYETTVAEWGSSLSAGQRQRVAIARALIRNTPILLFDEATSNIDVETEMEILQGIFSYLRGKTVVFVTHRMASAALGDRVCVLDAGRLVGYGKHRELLADCGLYRRMYSAKGSETRFRVIHEA